MPSVVTTIPTEFLGRLYCLDNLFHDSCRTFTVRLVSLSLRPSSHKLVKKTDVYSSNCFDKTLNFIWNSWWQWRVYYSRMISWSFYFDYETHDLHFEHMVSFFETYFFFKSDSKTTSITVMRMTRSREEQNLKTCRWSTDFLWVFSHLLSSIPQLWPQLLLCHSLPVDLTLIQSHSLCLTHETVGQECPHFQVCRLWFSLWKFFLTLNHL